ncbi:MAG: amidohydrolase, partial [Rhodobacterales bacterium]|nr:amidohydrolase [Rhodobacterales bacterium]
SGFFSNNALDLCLKVLGEDKILFAVDWPYADNTTGVNWLSATPISSQLKEKIFCGNAVKFLKL